MRRNEDTSRSENTPPSSGAQDTPSPEGGEVAGDSSTDASARSSESSRADSSADSSAVDKHETPRDGFELGGTVSANYGLVHGGQTPFGPLPTVHRGSASATAVWTRRGEGTVRSVDVSATTDVTGDSSGRMSPSGELTVGMNTGGLRLTLSGASMPGVGLPFAGRLALEGRERQSGDVRFGWEGRLGYFYTNELASPSMYRGERAPPHVLAAGGHLNLSVEHDFGPHGALHLSTDHQLGLDLFARMMPAGSFRDKFKAGHSTAFPLDTAAGIGSVYARGNAALTADLNLGRGWLLRPGLSHELDVEYYDPTIAPQLSRNALAAGARVYSPWGLSVAAAGEVDLHPTFDSNFRAVSAAVLTADYAPTDALRLSASMRAGEGGVQRADGSVAWMMTPDVALSAQGGWGPKSGAMATLGITVGFGGPRREVRQRRRGNELTTSIDPRRPYLDGRNEDRRYRSRSVRDQTVATDTLPQQVRDYLQAHSALKPRMSTRQVLKQLPQNRPDLALAYLSTPARIAIALDTDLPFAARGALPGRPAPRHPNGRELAAWAAAVMHHHGIEAHVVPISVGDRPASVIAFRDPKTATWNVLAGRRLSATRAGSATSAVERYCQGAGQGVTPQLLVHPPAEFRWGLSREQALALHRSVSVSTATHLAGLGDIEGLTYGQLVERVHALAQRDPAAATEAVLALLGSAGPFAYAFHSSEWTKFTPEEFWARGNGVCAEFHIFAARMLREAGVAAYPVELFSPGLAHVVTVYRDPKTGKWNVADYDDRHLTQADSPEAALAAYDPTYYKMVFLEDDGGLPASRAVFISPTAAAMRDFMRRPR